MLRWIPPLVATLLLAGPSGAQPCPELSGEVVLTGDLVCDRLYLPSDTTLDLNGYTVSAELIPGTPSSFGAGGVTLINGTVEDSWFHFEGCDDCLIERVHVDGQRPPLVNTLGDRNVLRDSRFTGVGFDLYHGSANVIEDSYFDRSGIGLYDSPNNTIRRNVFYRGGLSIWNEDRDQASFNRIEDNLFISPGFSAISIRIEDCSYFPESGPRKPCVEDNVIARNLIIGASREAIRVTSNLDCEMEGFTTCAIHAGALIESNVLIRNGHPEDGSGPYDAIRVVGLPEVVDGFVLRNNRVAFSGDHAIHAPGVTDGGGNRAVRSGNPEACVGVDCRPPGLRGQRAPLRPAAPGKANGARRLRAGEHLSR